MGLHGGAGRTRASNQAVMSRHRRLGRTRTCNQTIISCQLWFLARRLSPTETLLMCAPLLRRKAEHCAWTIPPAVDEATNTYTMGKPAVDGAPTRSGERKANDIVMLIFRALQFSRLAMLSGVAVAAAATPHPWRGLARYVRPRWRFCQRSLFRHLCLPAQGWMTRQPSLALTFIRFSDDRRLFSFPSRVSF